MNAVAPASTQPESSIPYRATSEVGGGDVATAIGWTLLLLCAAAGIALLARRMGWLQRLGAIEPKSGHDRLRVEQALRVSPKTTVFRLTDGKRHFLLAESREGVQLLALDGDAAGGDGDGN